MVEWKKLGEVCLPLSKAIIKQGDLLDNGCYPVINSGVTLYGRYNEYNNEGNAFTFASRGEYAGFITFLSNPFWAGGLCYPYRSKDENKFITKYVFQYLKNKEKYIMDTLVMRGGIPALNKADVEKIPIPLPSLSEQERIVGILDTFTSSIENLKAQISLRRKQYEHYRDKLLDLEGKEGVEMKTLKDVCKLERGIRVVKKDLQENGVIPVYQNSLTPLGFYERSNFPANTSFVICAGAAGEIGFSDIPFWAADDCTCMVCPLSINGKYIYHFLITKQHVLKSQVRKASVPRLSKDVIAKLPIPLPSFQEQSRIVSILDEFEASIKNLEAQLEARQKQYEYYRNKLLTFE